MIGISNSSAEKARNLLLLAFDSSNSKRKGALRAFKNILSLAQQRGYKDYDNIKSHLQSVFDSAPIDMGKIMVDRLTDKYLNDLYEYVSPDEILQLSKSTSFG